MDVRLTWTDCDEAGDYVVPNVLSPSDLAPDHGRNCPHTRGLTNEKLLQNVGFLCEEHFERFKA